MGRRVILLLSAMALMVVVSAGAALAASATFTNGPDDCAGTATNQNDRFAMGGGADVCNGLAGNDQIFGDHGSDTLNGGFGADHLQAGTGQDELNGGPSGGDFVSVVDNRANDLARGGPGPNDICAVDAAGEVGGGCEIVRVS